MRKSLFLASFLALLGCGSSKPVVICTMENPTTGTRVELFKEIPFKVPANYNEKRHIEEWKAEQVKKGFSREITP